MEKFINNHPFITMWIIGTICEAAVRIIRPEATKHITITNHVANEEKVDEEPTICEAN